MGAGGVSPGRAGRRGEGDVLNGRTTMSKRLLASGIAIAFAVASGALVSLAAADWKAPRTPWGEPDLQGTWTSQAELGVPFERPATFGTRQLLTDEEFA